MESPAIARRMSASQKDMDEFSKMTATSSSAKRLQKLLARDGGLHATIATPKKKTMPEMMPSAAYCNERIILNVGGQKHETFSATLNRLPDTRLAKLAQDLEDDPAYDKETGEFFFNRNPTIFLSILQYYRTGELHVDYNICGNAVKNEFDFWLIDPNDIEPCCWAQYARFLGNKETLKMLDDSFAIYEDVFAEPDGEGAWKKLQRRLWRLVEDPSYSVVGKVVAWTSLFFVMISIVTYILETHDFFRVLRPEFMSNITNNTDDGPSSSKDTCNCSCTANVADKIDLNDYNSDVVWWLNWITFLCFGWFALEYFFRLICCPTKKQFFKSTLNNLDLVVLCAMFIESLAVLVVDQLPRNRFLKILIPLRFARIFRIMKLVKHYRAFKVLVYTIKVSVKELLLMVIFLMIGVVIFACLVYYVEPDNFTSIPIGCWWALVTMTTVGYGDYHPNEVAGYFIGCVAAIFGVLMIAFTVPIVVNNFSLYYSHAQTRAKMRPKRRATKLLNKLAALTTFVPTLAEIQEEAEQLAAIEEKRTSDAAARRLSDVVLMTEQQPATSATNNKRPSADSDVDERHLLEMIRERGRRPSRLLTQVKSLSIFKPAAEERRNSGEMKMMENNNNNLLEDDGIIVPPRKRSFSMDRFMAAKEPISSSNNTTLHHRDPSPIVEQKEIQT